MLACPTFDVTGRWRPKAGANLQAQLAGGPVDGGVGHHVCVSSERPASVALPRALFEDRRCRLAVAALDAYIDDTWGVVIERVPTARAVLAGCRNTIGGTRKCKCA